MRRLLPALAVVLAAAGVGIAGFALGFSANSGTTPTPTETHRAYIDQEWKPVGDGARIVLRCTYHNSDGSVQVIEATPVYTVPLGGPQQCSTSPLR